MSLARNIGNLPNGDGAPVYACRAWVNFNGKNTVAIGASGNVSSITDNGTGDYTVNFTTAMPDANYAVTQACTRTSGGSLENDDNINFQLHTYSTSSIRGLTAYTDAKNDAEFVNLAIFR